MATDGVAFGLDAFALDDRMRLFHFTAAEHWLSYLWLLRAFDRGRASYHVRLHAGEVAELLSGLRAEHPEAPAADELELPRLLDTLVEWGNLDRGQDGARAATIAEYRNRHAVYQLTEAGYRAYQAVESVLGARLAEANLSRLIFPDVLADLDALRRAVVGGDAEEVYRKLSRLDRVLADMAERAARFYLMLADLARTNDTRPEIFLAHKDALLSHLRDFELELARYGPRLRSAVQAVEECGVERLATLAAEADERPFRTPVERLDDWRSRWAGMRAWFAPPAWPAAGPVAGRGGRGRSEAERLQDATVTAIGDVLALLRRVTEARRGGVSRESQLRHLAGWFAGCPTEEAAHALHAVVFGLVAPRHVGVAHEDPDRIASRRSWWQAPAVELSRTLVEKGRSPGTGRPAPIERADPGRSRLRAAQLAEQAAQREAAARLAAAGPYGRPLTRAEAAVLLVLLDRALAARVPTSALVRPAGAAYGVRLTLHPCPGVSTVETEDGRLHLDGVRIEVVETGADVASRELVGAGV
jgi:uncharacterized protein (TIGR02677 family)